MDEFKFITVGIIVGTLGLLYWFSRPAPEKPDSNKNDGVKTPETSKPNSENKKVEPIKEQVEKQQQPLEKPKEVEKQQQPLEKPKEVEKQHAKVEPIKEQVEKRQQPLEMPNEVENQKDRPKEVPNVEKQHTQEKQQPKQPFEKPKELEKQPTQEVEKQQPLEKVNEVEKQENSKEQTAPEKPAFLSENIDQFIEHISGYWKANENGLILFVHSTGVKLSSLPSENSKSHEYTKNLIGTNTAIIQITDKNNEDDPETVELKLVLDSKNNLALSFIVESEHTDEFVLHSWPEKERNNNLLVTLNQILDPINDKIRDNECKKLEREFLTNWEELKNHSNVEIQQKSNIVLESLAKSDPQSLVDYIITSNGLKIDLLNYKDILRNIQINQKRLLSDFDEQLIGDWSLIQTNTKPSPNSKNNQPVFSFYSSGTVNFPGASANKKLGGHCVTYCKNEPKQIECFMDGEKTWRKGIYKIENGNSLTIQWAQGPNADFPKSFGNKVFALQKIIKLKGSNASLSLLFIEDVKNLLVPILSQITAQGYSSEIKKQYINLIFQIPPISPLQEGSEIFKVAIEYSKLLQDDISQLEFKYSLVWNDVILSSSLNQSISDSLINTAASLY